LAPATFDIDICETLIFVILQTILKIIEEICSYRGVLQVRMCCGDETNEVMEASAEHDFRSIWTHWSGLHNRTVKYFCMNIFPLENVCIVCEITKSKCLQILLDRM